MNNLSDDRVKFYASANPPFGYTGSEINFMARELLALREARKHPVAVVLVEEDTSEQHRVAWTVKGQNLTDGRYELYEAPQLTAVPEGADERLAAAVELLKQAAPHMLADESLKDPDGALVGKRDAVPEGWVMVPKVPTKDMVRNMKYHVGSYDRYITDGYASMIAAAPKPEVN